VEVVAGSDAQMSGSAPSRLTRWFNKTCYQQPGSFALSNASRKLFNRVQFAAPNTLVGNPNFGIVTAAAQGLTPGLCRLRCDCSS
jgi:hypothetical protein